MTEPAEDPTGPRMVAFATSTERLRALLGAIHGAATSEKNPDAVTIEGLMRPVFKLPAAADRREVFETYQALIRVMDRAVEEAKTAYPDDEASAGMQADFVKPLVDIRSTYMGAGLASSIRPLAGHNPDQIRFHAMVVARHFRLLGGGAPVDIAPAIVKLDEALSIIEQSTASEAIKQLFRDSISRMKRAVDRADQFGPEEVGATFAAVSVEIYSNKDAQADKAEGIVKAMKFIADATTVVVNAVLIAKLLLLAPGAS